MESIKIMMEEHQYILRMLKVVRKVCMKILNHEEVDYKDFYKVIDFVRNYADKHHHSKEEELLFKELKINLNEENRLGPVTGMLVEHDQGRLYMQNLEAAVKEVEDGNEEAKLDVIANSISYTHLLYRHIDKEDNLIYPLGEKQLSTEILDRIEKESKKIEMTATDNKVQEKYIAILEELENKVG
ncbi:hemerythrin domain-containing protein [Vallitalea okinawensis]|uniref:hemerythrin domain-containing protein n=1 Tax=Vallitalea okinawensis TaxID=2078660 RepID=UPI000CFD37CA|nr:hemerythrin domain-containing protein [Vallitalea okinawensis]